MFLPGDKVRYRKEFRENPSFPPYLKNKVFTVFEQTDRMVSFKNEDELESALWDFQDRLERVSFRIGDKIRYRPEFLAQRLDIRKHLEHKIFEVTRIDGYFVHWGANDHDSMEHLMLASDFDLAMQKYKEALFSLEV